MSQLNATILDSIWMEGTNDYQQRIPQATQTSVAETEKHLFDPMNRSYYNQFVDALVNKVGLTYVQQHRWSNPLTVFKKERLLYGSTVEEIAVKWVKAHSYIDDAEDVFKMYRPDTGVWYHTQNRQDVYPITVNQQELRTAFHSEYGLNRLVAAILEAPMNSDEYDEYRIMLQLIAFYERNFGFFKYQLSNRPNDEASGREFLKALRTFTGRLRFPSALYNAEAVTDIPVFAKTSELVLLTTPDVEASVDVDALATLFNLDKGDIQTRRITVDEFPIPGAVALLTTDDFFQCRDTLYQNESAYNPKTLGSNYFLHHWGIYSVSPFVPAILFTTETGTAANTIVQNVTGISVTATPDTVKPGGKVKLVTDLLGALSKESDSIEVAPDACTYEIAVEAAGGASKDVPARTYVDKYGVLHVAKAHESEDTIKVTVTSTYANPSGATSTFTAEAFVTVS